MWPARIFGDVAADSRSALAGRIGRKIQPAGLDLFIQAQVNQSWFSDRATSVDVNIQHAVHAREFYDQATMLGHRATRKPRASAAPHQRHMMFSRPAHNMRYILH